MLKEIGSLLTGKWDFFGSLLLEHIEISTAAILIAIVFGGLTGILISEYRRTAKPTLSIVNFLYTIPSILCCSDVSAGFSDAFDTRELLN